MPTGLPAYAAGLAGVIDAFPDYHWRIRHLVVNRPILAAHLEDTGTHTGTRSWASRRRAGRYGPTELAVYAWSGGLIAEVWSVTDRLEVLSQLTDGAAD